MKVITVVDGFTCRMHMLIWAFNKIRFISLLDHVFIITRTGVDISPTNVLGFTNVNYYVESKV